MNKTPSLLVVLLAIVILVFVEFQFLRYSNAATIDVRAGK